MTGQLQRYLADLSRRIEAHRKERDEVSALWSRLVEQYGLEAALRMVAK